MALSQIKVYPADKKDLEERYGKPQQDAFHKLLVGGCPHLEESRAYTTAKLAGADVPMAGFHCKDCDRYIFMVVEREPVI